MRFPSPARLSATDQAIIAAFEAARGVTLCPPMTFTPEDAPRRTGKKAIHIQNRDRAEIARARVLPLASGGMEAPEIARHLKIGLSTVYGYIRDLKARGRL